MKYPLNNNSVKARNVKILCLSLILISTYFYAMPVYAQSNDVTNRLNRLENELDTLNRAVYRGDVPDIKSKTDYGSYDVASSSSTIANGEERIQQLETQIRDLTGQIEEQRYAINQLEMKLEQQASQPAIAEPAQQKIYNNSQGVEPQLEMNPDTNTQGEVSDLGAITPPQSTGIQTLSAGSGGSEDPTIQYEQAFADLKNERYQDAQSGFEAFLEKNKDHALTSNAKYWLGETYYVQGNYDKAARLFAEGYRGFPDSPKAPDNLLKLGLSLAGLGKVEDACVALGQLPKKHASGPGPILSRGEQEMKRLGCSQ